MTYWRNWLFPTVCLIFADVVSAQIAQHIPSTTPNAPVRQILPRIQYSVTEKEMTAAEGNQSAEDSNKIKIRLEEIKRDVNDWKDDFKRRTEKEIAELKKEINKRHEQMESTLMGTALLYLNKTANETTNKTPNKSQTPVCKDSIVAIKYLLAKLDGEMKELKSRLNPVASRYSYRQNSRSLPAPSSTLATVEKLNSRLNALDVELSTEMTDNCTLPLHRKYENITGELEFIRTVAMVRFRDAVVRDAVLYITSGKYEIAKAELHEIAKMNEAEFYLALSSIINKALSETKNFQHLVGFLKILTPLQFKNGMGILIKEIKSLGRYSDSNEFIRLAYESKNAFGSELKKDFPENVQQLIWGGTVCIRNRLTNQYLISNRTRYRENKRKPASNSTFYSNGNYWYETTESPLEDLSRLPVKTSKIMGANNRVGRSEFCGWEIYPLVGDDSLNFLIRQKIGGDWGWNLNTDKLRNVQVSPANVNRHFIWEIRPQDEGQYFSISSLHPDLVAESKNETVGYLDNFLCSTAGRSNQRDVVINPTLSNYCKWHLENPFETTQLEN